MTLLRFLLLVVLVLYGLRLLARWIFRSNAQKIRKTRDERDAGGGQRYRDLTDQDIEDADYEEIEPGSE